MSKRVIRVSYTVEYDVVIPEEVKDDAIFGFVLHGRCPTIQVVDDDDCLQSVFTTAKVVEDTDECSWPAND